MKSLKVILLLLSFMSVSHAEETMTMNQVVQKITSFTKKYEQRPYQVIFNSTTSPDGFDLACAYGQLCPDKKVSLTYVAQTKIFPQDFKESWVRLFFKKNDLLNLNLQTLQQTFDFASFDIDFSHYIYVPGYTIIVSESGKRGIVDSSDKKDWKFESFQQGKLKGLIKKHLTSISITRSDDWAAKNCDIMKANRHDGCWKQISIDLKLEVLFNLPISTEPLDCEFSEQENSRCGK